MRTPIAMGKIAADGTILKATPGITVNREITKGVLYGVNDDEDIGYKVILPDRLVSDGNYIVQLTTEIYEEDQDFVYTIIGLRYQSIRGFDVIIWANRAQTGRPIVPVYVPWHFVIYDIK
ncbi:MAG: hypothetical protein VXW38_01485 [Bacteroidota bacterium]|nr:hypothetical protein [Bacteroidota bacterium]